jgi:4-diphosphocytidyl-2-C-methyl-D-erythritol kinase
MICFPNAKINLGLHITEKRADGFHNIETVFYPIGWKDALETIENKTYRRGAPRINLRVTGVKVGSSRNNLVVKAYQLLGAHYDLPPVKAHLHKVIPMGAGLGGGSADGAFLINLLNDKFALDIPEEKRKEFASQLGSDCAFFIGGKPVFASGRGDVFSPIKIDLGNYFMVVVYPGIHSNTALAYKGVKPVKSEMPLQDVIAGGIDSWRHNLVNDFEKSIFSRFPELENIKEKFYRKGALYASMSGSGSSMFAIFEQKRDITEFDFPSDYLTWTSANS